MQPVSAGFLAALASPQQITVRADVSKAGARLYSGLPVLGGQIEVDSSSITRRRLTLSLAPRLPSLTSVYEDSPTLPRNPGDPLGHYGQEITVQWGLTYVDGVTEWVPAGVFRIDGAKGSLLSDGSVTVAGVSREAFVADARFTSPYTASAASAQTLIATLIHDVLPSAEVVASATMDRRVPRTTWDEDRWGAITDLADSIAAVVYADAWGRFVIKDAPTISTPPVWRVSGTTSGTPGVLVSADASSSRAKVSNGIIVRGESPSSDSPPVQGSAYDLATGSPTRWGDPASGAFGKVPRFMSIPSVTTEAQATAIAHANLAKYIGSASTVDASTVPNAALEADDVIEIITDADDPGGSVRRHVVDSFTLPLFAGGEFRMSTRDVGVVTYE